MERKINAKISAWCSTFKKDVVDFVVTTGEKDGKVVAQYIYNYPNIILEPTDFKKRQRIKNDVPLHERCGALRANEEQCTRRKREGIKFCGTHAKGIPHGEIDNKEPTHKALKKVQVWTEEISGIIRHLDNEGNVYNPIDIYQNNKNPRIIATYSKDGDKYSINH